MTELFFELIQISLGTRIRLSRTPSEAEWSELYDIAKKQSLVGVCFAGLQQLVAQQQEPPEMVYLTWMGMAAKIQQRNETLNEQCVMLQNKLYEDGLHSIILKGQGLACYYDEHLHNLRQSGDIDIFVSDGMKNIMPLARRYNQHIKGDYMHVKFDIFPDTEVEVHYRYGFLFNPWLNIKLQRWFDAQHDCDILSFQNSEINVPTPQFNAVYLLHHTYRHFFAEGVGFRQIMDYYYLLKMHIDRIDKEVLRKDIKRFGMDRFAGALMWVMKIVFDCPDALLVCKPNEREGRYLLNMVMAGGNFGHANHKDGKRSHMKIMADMVKHSLHMSVHYGQEALWAPIWHVYHFFWKRTSGRV